MKRCSLVVVVAAAAVAVAAAVDAAAGWIVGIVASWIAVGQAS